MGKVLGTKLPKSLDRIFRNYTDGYLTWYLRFAVLEFMQAQDWLSDDSPLKAWRIEINGTEYLQLAATKAEATELAKAEAKGAA